MQEPQDQETHPRFQINPLIPVSFWKTPGVVNKGGLFEACCLLTDVEELLREVEQQAGPAGLN